MNAQVIIKSLLAKREVYFYRRILLILLIIIVLLKVTSQTFQIIISLNRLSDKTLPQCFVDIETLGPLETEAKLKQLTEADASERQALSLQLLDRGLKFGGHSSPPDCVSKSGAIAIVVPLRDRDFQLDPFVRYMHLFLQKKMLNYRFFVIEQTNELPFNRGSLLNIGFVEALNSDPEFDCFIFHDVDMLPEHERNDYSCPPEGNPRQLAWLVDIWDYKPLYPTYAGGVTAISKKDFIRINGYSNKFWGWGYEDDDFLRRMGSQNLNLSRTVNEEYAKYRTLYHPQAKDSNDHMKVLNRTGGIDNLISDGISSLRYERKLYQLKHYYTHILVELIRNDT